MTTMSNAAGRDRVDDRQPAGPSSTSGWAWLCVACWASRSRGRSTRPRGPGSRPVGRPAGRGPARAPSRAPGSRRRTPMFGWRHVAADRRRFVDRREDVGRGVADRRRRLVAEVAREVAPDIATRPRTGHAPSPFLLASRARSATRSRPAWRFSMKARIPSRWSSVANRSKNASRSACRPAAQRQLRGGEHGTFGGTDGQRRHRGDGVGELQRRLDRLRRPGRPSSRVRRPSPRRRGIVRPVRMSSMARAVPTARVRRCVPARAGHDPDAGSRAGRTGRRRRRRSGRTTSRARSRRPARSRGPRR